MENSRNLDDEERHETSLMISYANFEYIKMIKKNYGSYSSFLSFLVEKNIKLLEIKPNLGGKVLTEYQKKGLNLKKLNFMPKSKDWTILRAVASHYTISISLLFAILLNRFLQELKEINKENRIVHDLCLKIFKIITIYNPYSENYIQYSKIKI